MKINGIKSTTALTIFSETGIDLKNKFPTEKQFLSWLNVVPDNKITGGKVISSRVRLKKNRAGQAFRDAASSLWRAQCPLGDYLRRKKARSGSKSAVVATAKKLASIYYKMVTEKVNFDPSILEQKSKEYLLKRIQYYDKMKQSISNQLSENETVDFLVI
jgi:transposase